MNEKEFYNNITKLEGKLRYFALSLTNGDKDDADDLIQETYLKAITYRNMFVHKSNFVAWLYTIMRNIFINNYRKSVRMKTSVDKTKDNYLLNSKQQEVGFPVDSAYTLNEINEVIDELKDEYRIPFQLYTSGHKYKEIAKELGLPIGTIKSRIFFARKSLMSSLKDYKYNDAA